MTVSKIVSPVTPIEEVEKINEIIDNLGGGSGITVDQTYSPSSTNAQSGTAVANAFDTKIKFVEARPDTPVAGVLYLIPEE